MKIKTLLSFFPLLFVVSLLIPAKYSSAKSVEGTREKENIANLLNYAQVSIYKITAFNHRLVLDREYQAILNNLNLRQIPDSRVIDLLTSLMDSLTGAILTDRERKQIDRRHSENVKRHARDFWKNRITSTLSEVGQAAGNVAKAAAGGATSVSAAGQHGMAAITGLATAYWDYQAQIEMMQDHKSEKNWSLDNKVIGKLNEIRKKMLRLSWELYNEFDIDENMRLVEGDLRELIEFNKERNIQKRLRLLNAAYMRKKFLRFAPYWYYLGSTAQLVHKTSGEVDHRTLALQAYNKYEEIRSAVLKKDEMYTTVALGRAELLDPEQDKTEIIRNLEIIEANPPESWMTTLGMALMYARLEHYEKARGWVQHNLDRKTGDQALHKQVMARIMAREGDFKSLTDLISQMASDNITRTFEILDMVGPLKPVEIANQIRPRLLDIRVMLNSNRLFADDIVLKVPLGLEKDTKKLTMISGAPVFDPNTNLRNLNSDQERNPDTVTHSEDGEVANYSFEKVFNEEKWVTENRSHILFRLRHEEQIIDLMFILMKGELSLSGCTTKEKVTAGIITGMRAFVCDRVKKGFADTEIKFKLTQIALGSDQFVDQGGVRFVEAGPLMRAKFDTSLEGLIFKLGNRYKIEGEAYGKRLRALLRALETADDGKALSDLVRAMKEEPSTGTLDIVTYLTDLEKPEKILAKLPVDEVRLVKQEKLLGKAVAVGNKALSIFGSAKIDEATQNLNFLFPANWITGRTNVTAEINPEVCEATPEKPEKTKNQQSWSFSFADCFNAERWQKDGIKKVLIGLRQHQSVLKFHFDLNGKFKDGGPTFRLKDVNLLRY